MTARERPLPRTSRRAFLRVAALSVAAACGPARSVGQTEPQGPAPARPVATTASPAVTTPSATPSPAATSSASPSAPTAAPLETPRPYVPFEGDVWPDAKQLAGRIAQALTTYDAGEPPGGPITAALAYAVEGLDVARLRAEAARLHAGRRSAGDVEYAQLGGLAPNEWDPRRASVMVVVRQRLDDDEPPVRRTLDVRLRRDGEVWQFEELASSGGQAVPRPAELPASAVAVLDHPNIDLPDTARWDIHAGAIDERLLETMVLLAERLPYAVTCLRSGHPIDVFGTDHVSNHTKGRAVDIWSVAGRPVVLQREDRASPAHEMTTLAFAMQSVTELGSPWDLDGPPPPTTRSFTNVVHADHVHVALERNRH